jgi:hypothetical protein
VDGLEGLGTVVGDEPKGRELTSCRSEIDCPELGCVKGDVEGEASFSLYELRRAPVGVLDALV